MAVHPKATVTARLDWMHTSCLLSLLLAGANNWEVACVLNVTNTGDANLTNIQPAVYNSSLQQGAAESTVLEDCTPSTLPTGATGKCTVAYTLTAEDLASATGSIALVAKASSDQANDTNSAASARTFKLGVLEVSALADIGKTAQLPGANVTITITITNAGPTNMTGISVTSSNGLPLANCSGLSLAASDGAVNSTAHCTTTYTVTAADAAGSATQKSLIFTVATTDNAKLAKPIASPVPVEIHLAAFKATFSAADCSALQPTNGTSTSESKKHVAFTCMGFLKLLQALLAI